MLFLFTTSVEIVHEIIIASPNITIFLISTRCMHGMYTGTRGIIILFLLVWIVIGCIHILVDIIFDKGFTLFIIPLVLDIADLHHSLHSMMTLKLMAPHHTIYATSIARTDA